MQSFLSKVLFSSAAQLWRTPLYPYHVEKYHGKMIEFAGYEMAVQYPTGVLQEHMNCRKDSVIFDVTHMGQVKIFGKDARKFVEMLVVCDIPALPSGSQALSLILNKNAGIIDDCMVTKFDDHMHMVVNGANKFKDLKQMEFIRQEFFKDADVQIKYIEDRSLIAIQGPKTTQLISKHFPSCDFKKFLFMQHRQLKMEKLNEVMTLSRSGYTGEDGYEISVSNANILKFMDILMKDKEITMAGLGCRDSLRLEAGLCLHGNDIDESTNAMEGSLVWVVRKTNANYFGREAYEKNKKTSTKRRVGFMVEGTGVVREHIDIYNKEGKKIGNTTSGTFSPILKKGIGMAYVHKDYRKNGTKLVAKVRNRNVPITLVKMPFVPNNYYKPKN